MDQIAWFDLALLAPDLHQRATGQDVEEFVGIVFVRLEMGSGGDLKLRDIFEI